jgi:hypothetical protein
MNENNKSSYPSYMFEFIHHPEYGCHNLKGLKMYKKHTFKKSYDFCFHVIHVMQCCLHENCILSMHFSCISNTNSSFNLIHIIKIMNHSILPNSRFMTKESCFPLTLNLPILYLDKNPNSYS